MNLLELAQEAGLAVGYSQHLATTAELQAFADLVLEEAAKACEEMATYDTSGDCAERIRELKGAK
jgi:hypothetical protein